MHRHSSCLPRIEKRNIRGVFKGRTCNRFQMPRNFQPLSSRFGSCRSSVYSQLCLILSCLPRICVTLLAFLMHSHAYAVCRNIKQDFSRHPNNKYDAYSVSIGKFIGLCNVMQFLLSHEKFNTWIHINIGWGFAITLCAIMVSKTSGGHMNPAVSLMFYTFGDINFITFFLYAISQTIGAIAGSIAAYLLYLDQFNFYAGDVRTITGEKGTAICFCTFPMDHVSNITAFFDQIIGTSFLTLFVCTIIDKRNKVPHSLHAILVGFILIVLGTSVGMNVGYPINPARDLGPRLFAYFLYGPEVFSFHKYYFWIPVVAPFIGAVLGGWAYHFFVGFHIKDDIDERTLVNSAEHRKLLKGY